LKQVHCFFFGVLEEYPIRSLVRVFRKFERITVLKFEILFKIEIDMNFLRRFKNKLLNFFKNENGEIDDDKHDKITILNYEFNNWVFGEGNNYLIKMKN